MKQLLIPLLSATIAAGYILPCWSQRYEAYSGTGQVETKGFDGDSWVTRTNMYQKGAMVAFKHESGFPTTHSYNLEWVDGDHKYNFPASCRPAEDYIGSSAVSNLRVYYGIRNDGAGTRSWLKYNSTDSFGDADMRLYVEPVNVVGDETYADVEYPKYIECDAGLESVVATGTGHFNVQKWWDGVMPNNRTTIQTETVYYRPVSSPISATFSPNTIQLKGTVNEYISTNSVLMITTSGGTQIEVEWPAVNLLEYGNNGEWIREHNQIVSVTDGLNKVDKQLRVRGTVAGTKTISVPVTITLR